MDQTATLLRLTKCHKFSKCHHT